MIILRLPVPVPEFLCRPAISILLFYRLMRYGYSFRLIPLTEGKYAIVDGDDYPRLAKHSWSFKSSGNNSYAVRFALKAGSKGHFILSMHKDVLETPNGLCVDHINGNGLDNRKSNLRLATTMQNNCNRRKRQNCSSRFKGVSWSKRKRKWRAKITCDGRERYLGVFADEEAAARAYDAKACEVFGEFAKLNFS